MQLKPSVKTGLDVLVASGFEQLKGLKLGLLAHAASVDCNLSNVLNCLLDSGVCELKTIFAPEHGFSAAAQDMISVSSSELSSNAAPSTGRIAIRSLYGSTPESLAPSATDLCGLDALLVDLQDVGARYYTYIQTMAFAMQTAARVGVRVFVLDRPNPIGGTQVEGSRLLPSCRSFCGLLPVPQRHGLTIGEAALLYNKGLGGAGTYLEPIGCQLEVIPMEGWKRSMYFEDTNLPWVLPSPNMPTLDTALVYPGTCLFETTNLSEGRGTTRPFEIIGAPFIDGKLWAEATADQGISLAGATLRPLEFEPQFHKWAKQHCGGVQIHITDRSTFQPLRWGLALLASARALYPQGFAWRKDAYEFVKDIPAVDLLYGSPEFRETLESNGDLSRLLDNLCSHEISYKTNRLPYLLYN